jgi:tubulin polyglutamylase TTLL6/13
VLEEHVVVQLYLNKPLCMDKMKFDLRLYVLILGINPLRIYLSKEGLARLSTKQYDEVNETNLTDMQMHLTNYSINKHSNNFEPNRAAILDSTGHKRSLKYTLRYMRKIVKADDEKLMREIKDIIVKTCISGQPALKTAFNNCQLDDFENSMCFHILGFDIMLDRNCKPYLLEVNYSPSLATDSPLDEKVKGDLIKDTVRLLGLTKKRKAMYRRNM